jgi:hypothetical protein
MGFINKFSIKFAQLNYLNPDIAWRLRNLEASECQRAPLVTTTYLQNREEMIDRSLLPSLGDIDGRINRIRFSVDILQLSQLYQKSLEDILGDRNNVLSHSEKFRVNQQLHAYYYLLF